MSVGWENLIVVFTAAVTLVTFNWLRSHLQTEAHAPRVEVLGTYSPVLTWLRYRRLPRLTWVIDWDVVRAHVLTAGELGLMFAWMLYLGREFLNWAPEIWPHGSEIVMSTQNHSMWRSLLECGPCFFWNGSTNGGIPSFVDLHSSWLHPLTALATLLLEPANSLKLIVLGAVLMAGLAQWWLGHVLGLRRLPRVWGALMAMAAGHLAGRMEMGNIPLLLSTAAASLVIPPALALALHGDRRSAVALGLMLGLAILSGQGYLQIGLAVCVAPALLAVVIKPTREAMTKPVWKEYALALAIALLIASPLLIPLAHFWPNFAKDRDPAFQSAQPLAYGWLNLIIDNPAFYRTTDLGKQAFPYLYINYLGWIPLVLALVAPVLIPRNQLRVAAFFGLTALLAHLAASSLTFRFLDSVFTSDAFTSVRNPAPIAGLAVPALLGLAAWAVHQLLYGKLSRRLTDQLRTWVWLLLPWPLILALTSAAAFGRNWLYVEKRPEGLHVLMAALQTPSTQWVQPPYGEYFWFPAAQDRHLKIAFYFRPWRWEGHPALLDAAVLATRDPLATEQDGFRETIDSVHVVVNPAVHYASLIGDSSTTPCVAHARNGDIEVTCESPQPGRLVVTESNWSGWMATVNGQPASVTGNPWLEVPLAAGRNTISFRYRPWDAPLGLMLSALGVVVAAVAWRRSKPFVEAVEISGDELDAPLIDRLAPPPSVAAAPPDLPPIAEVLAPARIAPTEASQTAPVVPVASVPSSPVRVMLEVPPGTRVRVTVETLTDGVVHVTGQDVAPASVVTVIPSISQSAQKWKWPLRWELPRLSPLTRPLPQFAQLNLLLAAGALLVYLLTRFIGLDQYPIYFLGDEAVHTVRAAQLVRAAGYHAGEYLPTYFANGSFLNLSVSVYAQVLPYVIFGSSVVVTRTVSVLLSLLAAAAVGLTLRDIFKVPYWWAATLLLGLMPVWFLHSRTAFESVEMASLYAVFLYAYLRYRSGSVRWLYGAAIFGALAFYTYSPGQMVMAVTGLLLLIADARYHWQHRATVLRVALLLIVLALPYVRFQLNHSEAAYLQLRERGSYLLDPNVPAGDKITHTVLEYLYGLGPSYWYNPQNPRDLTRHLMPGYGNLPWWTLPLALIGFGLALWRALGRERDPAYRVILLALLAAPTGGALAEIGNLRVLAFVIPATLLTALGLAQALQWLERRTSRRQLSLAAFVILAGLNGWMLREALVNGPTWSTDYGLYGMQYGSRQVFGELVPRLLREHPTARVIVSPSWANGTDLFTEFFLSARERSRVEMQGADYFRSELRNVSDTFIVWPRDEYEAALNEPKFGGLAVQEIIPYPDGTPGFYVVQLAYAENANALFAAEEAERRKPVTETAVVDGQTVAVTHSRFDGGALADLFDGDAFTLARGMVDNPIRFDLQFPAARPFTALTLTTATMERFTVRVQAYPPTGEPWVTEQVYRNLPADPTFEVPLDGAPAQITRLVIEIFDELATDPAHVHVREIVIGK